MFKWIKKGMIFSPDSKYSWTDTHAQCPFPLDFGNFIRIYFSCRPYKDNEGYAKSYTAFIDVDKHDLTKIINIAKQPVMPLGKLGTFDEFAVYPTSVIREDGTVYLYYAGWTRMKSVPFDTSIGLAFSKDDGVTFERIGDGPLLSANFEEPFGFCFSEELPEEKFPPPIIPPDASSS